MTELTTAKRHLYDLRFQLATRQLTDYSQIPQTRRTIARILTVLTERELSEAGQPVAPAARAGPMNGASMTTTKRKAKVGRVVSDKMDKTIVVSVERLARHRALQARHPPDDQVQGPRRAQRGAHRRHRAHRGVAAAVSATKRWRLVEIVERAGEGASEAIVAEEAATTEAIHMAAHPGRAIEAADGGAAA